MIDLKSKLELNKSGVLHVKDLGLIPYEEAYDLQKRYVKNTLYSGEEFLILCEHPTAITLGRLAKLENVILPEDELVNKGVKLINIDRGGDITLHCPGQLVLYPILNLSNYRRDLKYYLNKLEQVAIDFLKEFDILACRNTGFRGVWVKDKKIASIGIGVMKWVSYHGMAININSDLDLFSMIRPCGLDVKMTSVQQVTNINVDFNRSKNILIDKFCKEFGLLYERD